MPDRSWMGASRPSPATITTSPSRMVRVKGRLSGQVPSGAAGRRWTRSAAKAATRHPGKAASGPAGSSPARPAPAGSVQASTRRQRPAVSKNSWVAGPVRASAWVPPGRSAASTPRGAGSTGAPPRLQIPAAPNPQAVSPAAAASTATASSTRGKRRNSDDTTPPPGTWCAIVPGGTPFHARRDGLPRGGRSALGPVGCQDLVGDIVVAVDVLDVVVILQGIQEAQELLGVAAFQAHLALGQHGHVGRGELGDPGSLQGLPDGFQGFGRG